MMAAAVVAVLCTLSWLSHVLRLTHLSKLSLFLLVSSLWYFPHRTVIATLLPVIRSIGGTNRMAEELAEMLQQNNIEAGPVGAEDCDYLKNAVASWLNTASLEHRTGPSLQFEPFVLWAAIEPSRCGFSVITNCDYTDAFIDTRACQVWTNLTATSEDVTSTFFANELNLRVGGIKEYKRPQRGPLDFVNRNRNSNLLNGEGSDFAVRVFINHNPSVANT